MEYNDGLASCLVLVSKDFICLPCQPRPAGLEAEKACEVGEVIVLLSCRFRVARGEVTLP